MIASLKIVLNFKLYSNNACKTMIIILLLIFVIILMGIIRLQKISFVLRKLINFHSKNHRVWKILSVFMKHKEKFHKSRKIKSKELIFLLINSSMMAFNLRNLNNNIISRMITISKMLWPSSKKMTSSLIKAVKAANTNSGNKISATLKLKVLNM